MRNGVLTIATFISVILFPWPLTAFLALVTSFYVPLMPLAVGIFTDTLYYAPHANMLPWFSICGAFVSVAALFVRSRLATSIIR